MSRKWARILFFALLSLSVVSQVVVAQNQYGSLVGNVTDSSGAAIPGATVTVTHTETNLTRETVSNATGAYSVPNIPSGTYKVVVAVPGFQTFEATGITVTNRDVRVDAKLGLGTLEEAVTVLATAAHPSDRERGGPAHRDERIRSLLFYHPSLLHWPESARQHRPRDVPMHLAIELRGAIGRAIFVAARVCGVVNRQRAEQLMGELVDGGTANSTSNRFNHRGAIRCCRRVGDRLICQNHEVDRALTTKSRTRAGFA